MTTTTPARPIAWPSALYALGFATLWIAAAAWRPTLTFHLAPILVAGAGAFFLAIDTDTPLVRRQVSIATVIGTGVALLATAVISLVGWMEGPTLLPSGGPAVEGVVFALAGGVAGWLFAGLRPD